MLNDHVTAAGAVDTVVLINKKKKKKFIFAERCKGEFIFNQI